MDEQSVINQEAASPESPSAQQKMSDKDINFARLRQEREHLAYELEKANIERQKLLEQMNARSSIPQEDDEDEDGYIEPEKEIKRLKKALKASKFESQKQAEHVARRIVEEENKKNFLFRLKAEHPDYDAVVNDETALKLEQQFPGMANSIKNIPDDFERRKLAYETIKSLNLHKPKKQEPIMQDKIDSNRKSLYYTPSSSGSGPAQMGDFSPTGRKAAYEKMRELMKKPLRA
ncbi:MAG TPA: hypothetical protein VFX43_09370 [Chitinophagaceae bacterium]|nr:hypothetical protein [Chitinophagaceae bacterium]